MRIIPIIFLGLMLPASVFAATCGPGGNSSDPVDDLRTSLTGTSCPNGLMAGCTVTFCVTPLSGGRRTDNAGDPRFSCTGPGRVTGKDWTPTITATAVSAPTPFHCTVTVDGVSADISLTVYPSFNPPPPLDNAPGGPLQSPSVLGPTPSLLGVPNADPNATDSKYCAYKSETGLPICICSTEAAAASNNCASVEFCATKASGGCIPVKREECSGSAPLGPEGQVVNQKIEDVGGLIESFYVWSISVAGLAMFLSILYAGFEWLTAAGNPSKIGRARGRIYNSIMGTILLLSSYVILNIINPDFVTESVNFPVLGVPAPPRPTPAIPHAECTF